MKEEEKGSYEEVLVGGWVGVVLVMIWSFSVTRSLWTLFYHGHFDFDFWGSSEQGLQSVSPYRIYGGVFKSYLTS